MPKNDSSRLADGSHNAPLNLGVRSKEYMTRPVSITVIAWIIIALSVEGLLGAIGGFITPIFTSGNFHMQYALSTTLWLGAASLILNIILSSIMLQGFNWARIVYVCLLWLALVGIVLGRQPLALWISTGTKAVIFSYFLFRRESNAYFTGRSARAT